MYKFNLQNVQSSAFKNIISVHYNLSPIGCPTGKGKYGDVFLARARAIRPIEQETLVVVKSLLTKTDTASIEFHNEMEMYNKLDHPNIIRLLGVCREAEPFFMITEYCDWVSYLRDT